MDTLLTEWRARSGSPGEFFEAHWDEIRDLLESGSYIDGYGIGKPYESLLRSYYAYLLETVTQFETVSGASDLTLLELAKARRVFHDIFLLGPQFEPEAFGQISAWSPLKTRAWEIDRQFLEGLIQHRAGKALDEVLSTWRTAADTASRTVPRRAKRPHADTVILSICASIRSQAWKYRGFSLLNSNPRDFTEVTTCFRNAREDAKAENRYRRRAGEKVSESHLDYLSFWYYVVRLRQALLDGNFPESRRAWEQAQRYAAKFEEKQIFPSYYYNMEDLCHEELLLSACKKLSATPNGEAGIQQAAEVLEQWNIASRKANLVGKGRYYLLEARRLALMAAAAMIHDRLDVADSRLAELDNLVEERTSLGNHTRELWRVVADARSQLRRRHPLNWGQLRRDLARLIPLDAHLPVGWEPAKPTSDKLRRRLPRVLHDWLNDADRNKRLYALHTLTRGVSEYLQRICARERLVAELMGHSAEEAPQLPAGFPFISTDQIAVSLESIMHYLHDQRRFARIVKGVRDLLDQFKWNPQGDGHDVVSHGVGSLMDKTAYLFPLVVEIVQFGKDDGGTYCEVQRFWGKANPHLRIYYRKPVQLAKVSRAGLSPISEGDKGQYWFLDARYKWHDLDELFLDEPQTLWFYGACAFGDPAKARCTLLAEGQTEDRALPILLRTLLPSYQALNIDWPRRQQIQRGRDEGRGGSWVASRYSDYSAGSPCIAIADQDAEAGFGSRGLTAENALVFFLCPDIEGCDPRSLAEALDSLPAEHAGDRRWSQHSRWWPDGIALTEELIKKLVREIKTTDAAGTNTLERLDQYMKSVSRRTYFRNVKALLAEPLAKQMGEYGVRAQNLRMALLAVLYHGMGLRPKASNARHFAELLTERLPQAMAAVGIDGEEEDGR